MRKQREVEELSVIVAPDPFERLKSDIKEAAKLLDRDKARFFLDTYYNMQNERIKWSAQAREARKKQTPNAFIELMENNFKAMEYDIKVGLTAYAQAHEAGRWAMSIHGVGGIIAAGLLAYIDIHRAEKPSQVIQYAGLNPNLKWLGKEKAREYVNKKIGDSKEITNEQMVEMSRDTGHPWQWLHDKLEQKELSRTKTNIIKLLSMKPNNGALRELLWNFGQSVTKTAGSDKSFYGRYLIEEKIKDWEKNLCGEHEKAARQKLEDFEIGKDTDAYKWYDGYLSPKWIVDSWELSHGSPSILKPVDVVNALVSHQKIETAKRLWEFVTDLSGFEQIKQAGTYLTELEQELFGSGEVVHPDEIRENKKKMMKQLPSDERKELRKREKSLNDKKEAIAESYEKQWIDLAKEHFDEIGLRAKVINLGKGNGVRMLPPAHIQQRAETAISTLFLSHFHHVLYESTYGKEPRKPYVMEYMGHTDYIPPPNWNGSERS